MDKSLSKPCNKHERVGMKPHSFQELSVVFPIKIYHNQNLYANRNAEVTGLDPTSKWDNPLFDFPNRRSFFFYIPIHVLSSDL